MNNHIRRSGKCWVADFSINGKRHQYRRKTKGEAADAMALAIANAAHLPAPEAAALTIGQARQQSILVRWSEAEETTQKTAYGYSQQVVDFFGVDTPLVAITPMEMDRFRQFLKAKGNENATINWKMSTLRCMFTDAVARGQVPAMPTMPKRLKPAANKERVFSVEEEERFIETFRLMGHEDYADLMVFLLELGCRFGEAQRSLAGHVNTQHKTISFLKTKTSRPRTNPCTDRLWEVLQRRLSPNSRAHLFPDLSYRSFQHQFDRVKGMLGLEDDAQLTIHCTRHTCASRMITHVSLAEVMHWGGWTSLASVQRYLHLNVQSLGNAKRALETERALMTTNANRDQEP